MAAFCVFEGVFLIFSVARGYGILKSMLSAYNLTMFHVVYYAVALS